MKRSKEYYSMFNRCFDDKLSNDYKNYLHLVKNSLENSIKNKEKCEKILIVPKEWIKNSNIEYKTYRNPENETYLKPIEYLKALMFLRSYFSNHTQKTHITIKTAHDISKKIERLLKIWAKNKIGKDNLYIRNKYETIYVKIMNNMSLNNEDYLLFESLLEGHYKNKGHKKLN